MRLLPLHDRVVLRRVEVKETTKAGIITPDTAKERPQEAEVLAVGPGIRNEKGDLPELGVKVGDRVIFGAGSGSEVVVDGEEVVIMKESDIIGILVA